MKFSKTVTNWILISFLLGGFAQCCGAQGIIVRPPGNITICEGKRVTINCGYESNASLPVTWIIDGTSFSQEEIINSSSYQLNNATSPLNVSLTIKSIKSSINTQCVVHSTSNITSRPGTVTVIEPVVTLTSLRVGCGYVYVSWTTVNREICRIVYSAVQLRNSGYSYTSISFDTYNKFTKVPSNALLTVNIYVSAIYILSYGDSVVPDYSTSVRTKFMESPTFESVTASVHTGYYVKLSIRLSWQIAQNAHSCIVTIDKYKITVMDQYSPASVTTYGSSIEISWFSYNRSSIVANRVYNITVSAISDARISYPSDPIIVNTFILKNCDVTSPSTGTIRVSCDISHPILVTLTCTNNCNNPMMNSSGSSPLTVTGLDPGVMYSVTITIFNDNEVGLRDQTLTQTITVNSGNELNVGAVVGGVIGGVAAIVIIIIIILLICYFVVRKKKGVVDDDDDKESLQRSPMLQTSESYKIQL